MMFEAIDTWEENQLYSSIDYIDHIVLIFKRSSYLLKLPGIGDDPLYL